MPSLSHERRRCRDLSRALGGHAMLREWGCACPAQDKSGSISGHDRADLGSGHVLEADAAGLAAWHDVYLNHHHESTTCSFTWFWPACLKQRPFQSFLLGPGLPSTTGYATPCGEGAHSMSRHESTEGAHDDGHAGSCDRPRRIGEGVTCIILVSVWRWSLACCLQGCTNGASCLVYFAGSWHHCCSSFCHCNL
jgi:hypothetical protein